MAAARWLLKGWIGVGLEVGEFIQDMLSFVEDPRVGVSRHFTCLFVEQSQERHHRVAVLDYIQKVRVERLNGALVHMPVSVLLL